jgi:hypothetical protein
VDRRMVVGRRKYHRHARSELRVSALSHLKGLKLSIIIVLPNSSCLL